MRRSVLARAPRSSRAVGLVIVLFGSAMFVQSAGADGIGSQQQQVKDDLAEINRLDQKASQLNEAYLGYINQKTELDAEIATAQQKITAQQATLGTLQGQLANLAVSKFTGGGSDALGPLFSDPSKLNDGLQRDQLAEVAVNAGNATTDNYNDLLTQLDQEQATLQAKQAKAAKLAQQASDASAQATQAGAAYQAELTKDQNKLGDLLAQEQQRQLDAAAAQHAKDVAAAQAKQQAEADARAAKAATASTKKSTANDTSTGNAAADNATGNVGAANASTDGNGSSNADIPAAQTSSKTKSSSSSTSPTVTASSDGSSSNGSSGDNSSGGSSSGSSDTAATTPAPPPVSSRAEIAVNAARSQLGVPYKFAMSSPGVAFDCSGLTSYAWKIAGVSIPHQSAQQYATTPHVAITDIQPGDLLYFYHPISHVSIYIGNGQEIQAPAPGKFVEIAKVDWAGLVGASRPG